MDHPHTEQDAAVAAVHTAEAAASTARALQVFDAIDANTEHLTRFDTADFAFATWQTFVDVDPDVPLTDEQIAQVMLRAAPHLEDEVVVDLIDAQYPDVDKRVDLAGGSRLVWDAAAKTVLVSYAHANGVLDVVHARPTHTLTAARP